MSYVRFLKEIKILFGCMPNVHVLLLFYSSISLFFFISKPLECLTRFKLFLFFFCVETPFMFVLPQFSLHAFYERRWYIWNGIDNSVIKRCSSDVEEEEEEETRYEVWGTRNIIFWYIFSFIFVWFDMVSHSLFILGEAKWPNHT